MISAILRAQILSMRIRTASRGPSTVFSIITGIFYYGFWSFLAALSMAMFSIPSTPENMLALISIALFIATVYWQLAPLLTASFGASLDLRKLLIYPIPPGKLFLVEVLLRISTCAEMLLVLGGISIGLVRNPEYRWKAAPLIVVGAIAFAAMNLLLSAGTRLLIERLFRTPRWKEAGFLLFMAICIAPQFLLRMHPNPRLVRRLAPSEIFWPWAAAGRLMVHNHAALAVLIMAFWVVCAYSFGKRQFLISLRFDASERARPERDSGRRRFADRLAALPERFLPDPVAALVEKELRMLFRISRVRMVFAMSCFFGILLFLPTLNGRHRPSGSFIENAMPIMAVYGLLILAQTTFWNCFGFDRGAAMGYFCWPVRLRNVLVAKNITVVFLILPQILIIWMVTAITRLPARPGKFIEAIAVVITACLYWFGLGNIFSVRLPRAMDPDKMNQMTGKLQALTVFLAPLLLLPIVLAYIARAVFGSEIAFAGVMALAFVIGAIVYYVCLDSAVEAAKQRRETIIAELSRSEGPISIT